MSATAPATPIWYDCYNIHNPHACGQVEVVLGKIVRASNAYRWAIGLYFEDFNDKQFRKGYHTARRYGNAAVKNLGTEKSTYRQPRPGDRELNRRVSP
jgi:hypothetical protein